MMIDSIVKACESENFYFDILDADSLILTSLEVKKKIKGYGTDMIIIEHFKANLVPRAHAAYGQTFGRSPRGLWVRE